MDLNQARWRKSSYSANGGGECVEIAHLNAVAVRDSKNTTGPTLAVPTLVWHGFLKALSR